MSALSIARNALEAILKVGRGSSGRLILEISEEQAVRDALAASNEARTDVERQYEELFKVAVKAAAEANCGIPQTHDALVDALQIMAIQADNS